MNSKKDYSQIYQDILTARKRNRYCTIDSKQDRKIFRCGNISERILLILLNQCQVGGDGHDYENIITDSIGKIFSEIFDCENVEQHFSSKGGFGDIEFPFCIEALHENPCWQPWYYNYGIKSIIVEVKNKKNKAGPEQAGQIKRYIDTAKKGYFGILVSRYGFTKGCLKTLRSYAEDNLALILPLDHNDMVELIKLSMENSIKIMKCLTENNAKELIRLTMENSAKLVKYLRRKETLLLRIR